MSNVLRAVTVFLILPLVTAVDWMTGAGGSDPPTRRDTDAASPVLSPARVETAPPTTVAPVDSAPPDVEETARGLNAAAFRLYAALARWEGTGNLVYSPYGLNRSLALASMAARGRTEHELARWLHAPADRVQRGAALRELDRDVRAHSALANGVQLLSADRLWLQQCARPAVAFTDLLREDFGASVGWTDFAARPTAARAEVNTWVKGRTDGLIADLLGPDDVSATTRTVLTSALSFKGAWEDPFDLGLTRALPFSLGGTVGGTVIVPTMSATGSYRYGEFEDCQVVEIPYKGEQFVMNVVLPAEGRLAVLENGLSERKVTEWVRGLESQTVRLRLPRFRLHSRVEVDETMRGVGMSQPFSAEADFSGLTEGGPSLGLDNIVHEAWVEVDESGTRAASGTGAGWGMRSRPAHFDVDRPFLFLVRDRSNGVLLFLGRVADPSSDPSP